MPERIVERLLLGPGPSNVPPEVMLAMARPTLGHLDPDFLACMQRLRERLGQVFRTRNRVTFAASGTGTSGMETVLTNLVEAGERVVVVVNGYFGGRGVELARRLGAEVAEVKFPWGEPADPAAVEKALAAGKSALLYFVHAETSTGVRNDAAALAAAGRRHGALVVMDCVTSLGGLNVDVDGFGVDAAFSGSQKCLGAPSGMAPVTFHDRAVAKISARKTPVPSVYLDALWLEKYWGSERAYHHTAPIHTIYAFEEALRLVLDEGLDARFARHVAAHRALAAGVAAMGFELLPPEPARLPMLNAVRIPAGFDDAPLRKRMLLEHGIEIGSGLGELKGRIVRVGLMGVNANRGAVVRFLAAFEESLRALGTKVPPGAGVAAALGA
jgi:alanine-glyoxylate transaminase/serine-glyoxylate transaminase/serine-pyruvate transaminase